MIPFRLAEELRRDAVHAVRGFTRGVAVLFVAGAAAAAWLPARSAAAVDPLTTIRHE